MKTIRKFALWLGIATVVALATTGLYLFNTFQAKRLKTTQQPYAPRSEQLPSLSTTTDQTNPATRWLVLDRPNNANYSIKYPSNWHISSISEENLIRIITNFDPTTVIGSLSPRYRPIDSQAFVVFQLGVSSDQQVLSEVNKTVDNVPIRLRKTRTIDGPLSGLIHWVVLMPGEYPQPTIDFYPADSTSTTTFEEMLNTIRFPEPTTL